MSNYTDELLEEIHKIASLIYYQCSLDDQDNWLTSIMEKGIWLPEDVEDES